MRLLMKAKNFTLKETFTIRDGDGNNRYYVVGGMFNSGKRLHIRDTSGSEVASVREKTISLRPKFYLYVGEKRVGEIFKETTLFHLRYKVSGLDWVIRSNADEHEYVIMKGKATIASVRKKRLSLSDSYVFDIADDRDVLSVVAAVLATDMVD